MAAQILDGKASAQRVKDSLTSRVARLSQQGIAPGLGTILVGDDPASATYVSAKHKACEETGIRSVHQELPRSATQEDVVEAIDRFNSDPAVSAFLVQLPLPKGLDEASALMAVDPAKDADGLHPANLGKLVMGAQAPLPCTPAGIQQLLADHQVPIEGRHIVIVGRGLTIGRPLALLMALKRENANAAVTVVHTGVEDLGAYTRQGDIVIAAAGTPSLIRADMVKPGVAVVGAGITREGNKIVSDVDESVAEVAAWVTPRVGGVGPMTVAMLLQNTVMAAELGSS